jgi:hypothetical protein
MVHFDSEEEDLQLSVQTVCLDAYDSFDGFCAVFFHRGKYI